MVMTGNAIGYIGMQDVATPETALQATISRLSQLRERSGMISSRMSRVVDRAFGGSDGNTQAQPKAVPNGVLGAMDDELNAIEAQLAGQELLLNRLDGLV